MVSVVDDRGRWPTRSRALSVSVTTRPKPPTASSASWADVVLAVQALRLPLRIASPDAEGEGVATRPDVGRGVAGVPVSQRAQLPPSTETSTSCGDDDRIVAEPRSP